MLLKMGGGYLLFDNAGFLYVNLRNMFAVIKIPLPAHSPFVPAIIVFKRVTRAVLINPYSTTEIVKKYTSFDCITIEELRN